MNFVKFICVVLLSFLTTVSLGQDFKGGIKAGFNLSQIDGDKLAGYHKGGLIFGAYVNRKLNSRLNLQMEMIYINKGSKLGTNPEKGQYDYFRIAADYIEVPVLLQFWVEKIQSNFEAGLTFSTLISTKQEDQYGEVNLIGDFKRFGMGYLLGFNYQFGDQLSGTARFAYSIIPVGKDNKVQTRLWASYGGSYHHLLEFTLNYYLQREQ